MRLYTVRHLGAVMAALLLGACDNPAPSGNTAAPQQETVQQSAPLQSAPLQSEGPVHYTTLANGMQVIVKEDHRAPVVVSQVWYRVGSSYEAEGYTGVSHVLEHMMFKGTERYPTGEFSRIISENGGRDNAFTGRDFTSYFQLLEKSRLPIALELEADRMRGLLLPEEEFQKERDVVIEERRLRTEDDPGAYTAEQFYAAAFQVNPYHHPIIGWMDDLQNLTIDDLRHWYAQWYAPNNATLVVAGDVDPAEVVALAERHFGPIAPSEPASVKPRREPAQKGERRITVRLPAELPKLLMGYKVPVLRTCEEPWKAYALEVLAHVLDGGDSARFTRELVRGEQLAAGASAGYDLFARHDSLFTLSGVPANGHDIATLEQALRAQIERLKTEPVSAAELDRIKAQVSASKVFEQDSVFYQAMSIGMLDTVGLDWREADRYLERIAAVTPEQLQQVAREYLIDEHLTVAVLEPVTNNTEGE